MQQKTIAAIDLGTSKFSIAVARISGEDVEIEYYREHPAAGIRNSFVFNPKLAIDKLKSAIGEAEEALHIKIRQAVVGLPRYSVRQVYRSATFDQREPNEYISREEIENLKDIALNDYPLEDEAGEEVYGAVAQSFSQRRRYSSWKRKLSAPSAALLPEISRYSSANVPALGPSTRSSTTSR